MLLSVPLTVMVRIGLEANPETRWIAVLLGPSPESETPRKRRVQAREKRGVNRGELSKPPSKPNPSADESAPKKTKGTDAVAKEITGAHRPVDLPPKKK